MENQHNTNNSQLRYIRVYCSFYFRL